MSALEILSIIDKVPIVILFSGSGIAESFPLYWKLAPFFISRKFFLCLFMIKGLLGNITGFFPGTVPSVLFKHPWYLTVLLFLFFLLQTQKFDMNFDISKEKGEKTPNQSNPKSNSQTPKHTKQFTRNPKTGSFVGQFSLQMCTV